MNKTAYADLFIKVLERDNNVRFLILTLEGLCKITPRYLIKKQRNRYPQ